jgi:predicted RNA-binding Zn ribbon-like protein
VSALVACDAFDLVTSPAAGRLRECADPDCRVLFLENSRPGAGRWTLVRHEHMRKQVKKATFRGRPAPAG